MGSEPFLTTAQVAALLHKAPETIRYWRHKGTGPRGVKVGQAVVYPRSSVDSWRRRENLVPEDARSFRELVDLLLARRRPEDVIVWLDEHRDAVAAGEWEQLLDEASADE